MATTTKANGSRRPVAPHVGAATSANTQHSLGPWSKVNMPHHPEYDPGAGGPKFSRDASGKRLAPISQLNSPIGRKLARPRTSPRTRVVRDVSGTHDDATHSLAGSSSRNSATSLRHVQRQLSAPPSTQILHAQPPADVPPSATSQLGYTRKLSDRDLLASQQTRRAASDTGKRRTSTASEVNSGPSRSSTTVFLKRTLTIRRSSTTRELSCAKDADSQKLPDRSATFSAGTRNQARRQQCNNGTTLTRRFSFDYGPEILSLAPSQDHERIPEPKKWCQCKHPLIPKSSKICTTCNRVPPLTEQLEHQHDESEVDECKNNMVMDAVCLGRGVRPPQTFEEILGCVQWIPTALMGS
ncbi:hypothetical protein FB567DRAFT_578979 [Paraphoma chrysanthemicola]|uniref:Uncharacterized protein n=1 Tax=Paraphoma chrysanthemicola TaxID=798071 RepID=A0A8K0R6E5_9PLEO|nr:hypothetical protein FB567DRAFT_578979 [Paraphoma chrysanthemicola]